jgi:NADPH:quinone reductase-like Zn-dependent oxidoreductase
MKAIRIHEYGGPDVLKYEEAPIPDIGPDGVLIRVRAAGVIRSIGKSARDL